MAAHVTTDGSHSKAADVYIGDLLVIERAAERLARRIRAATGPLGGPKGVERA